MTYVMALADIEERHVAIVGGKGASLGTLARIAGVRVPPGFCVTTAAFDRVVAPLQGSADLRHAIEAATIPADLAAAITGALDEHAAYAVRSSATAEDSPTASFAGQHDSYLNVVGPAAVLAHVRRCWASLFTERAVAYRERNGFDPRRAQMAVVVQRMVSPRAAGVLFTADPISGHRKIAVVEAVAGLGEALVAGHVTPDSYQVRGGEVVARAARQEPPVLTDAQLVALVKLGRLIEAQLGRPQDIEWCLDDAGFHVVQSRPITTLFPIPAAGDGANHVYLSVGHQQMMTDAMKPLGLSLFRLVTPAPMHEAGGRLFVDVTQRLASPASRAALLDMLGNVDPLIRDVLQSIVDRGDFLPPPAPAAPAVEPPAAPPLPTDPAIVVELIAASQASIDRVAHEIESKSGPALLDFIEADLVELKRLLFDPRSTQVFMAAFEATWWLNEHLHAWLGEPHAADPLAQSVEHNVTSQMGLALLDVADAIRPYPEVIAFLERVEREDFLDALPALPGGREAQRAITAFLDAYGARCVGEIDITRPRWRERPTTLVPMILGNLKHFEPGAGARRFEAGRVAAAAHAASLLARVRALPDGDRRADETARMIDRLRAFIGYREYPKYGQIRRYFVYKQALMREAARLADARVLRDPEDIFFLTFQELQALVRTHRVDPELLRRRKDAFRSHQALTPPRVLTSDGERLAGAYRCAAAPPGALVGLPVSAGTVEGRARVILDIERAALAPGDILVTAFTDPSWTPLFVSISGLVTEVGGVMTHGAVIAREYGLPALVGVPDATRRIRDGQRIRLHATAGYIELLD